MPRSGPGIELALRGIARLIGVEFRLRHARIVDVVGIEAAIGARRDQIARAKLDELLAPFAAVLRILARGLSGFFGHALLAFAVLCRAVNVTPPLAFREAQYLFTSKQSVI